MYSYGVSPGPGESDMTGVNLSRTTEQGADDTDDGDRGTAWQAIRRIAGGCAAAVSCAMTRHKRGGTRARRNIPPAPLWPRSKVRFARGNDFR